MEWDGDSSPAFLKGKCDDVIVIRLEIPTLRLNEEVIHAPFSVGNHDLML